jgi:hypothetical protein
MVRFILPLILALGVLWLAPWAVAAAPPFTGTFHDTFSDVEVDTVCGQPGTEIQIEGKSVFHITEFNDGRYHLTGTVTGRFTFEVDGETFTGRFTQWFGENSNSKSFNGTFTFSATGRGDEGSRVHLRGVAHFTVNANGDVTVEFEKFNETCG